MKFLPSPCFLLIMLIALSQRLQAQPSGYQFSGIDIFSGLSNNQVNCIYKDVKGFMWFGTMSGLNRYDGYSFKIFRHQPRDSTSLIDDYISGISEAPGRKLFIQTRNGDCIYDQRTETFQPAERYLQGMGLPAKGLQRVVLAGTNYLFVYSHLIFSYDVNAGIRLIFSGAGKEGSGSIADVKPDSKNNLVIIYTDGLITRTERGTGRIISTHTTLIPELKDKPRNFSLFVDKTDNFWIYVAINPLVPNEPFGLVHFDIQKNVLRKLSKDNGILNNDLIFGLTQDDQGWVWVGTDHGGVNLVNPVDFSSMFIVNNADIKTSIAQNSIYSLYKDDRGIIWVGTYKRGISYYHERIFKFPLFRHQLSNPQSLPYDDVNRFIEDGEGNIWIGTNGGGLIRFNPKTQQFHQYLHDPANENSLGNDVIVSLFIDQEKKMWIGTYFGGLDCFDGTKFTHYRHGNEAGTLSDDRVWEIYEDRNRQLWVGTVNGGLNKLDRRTNKFTAITAEMPNSVSTNYISAIQEDGKGNLWVGTSKGLDILEKNTGKFLHFKSETGQLSDNYIISIYKDSQNNMWVGTRDGLNVIDPDFKRFQSFNMNDGLPDKHILNILEDDQHHLWISTPSGISKIEIRNSADKIELKCQNYDELDGLQGRQFNENAALKVRSGEILFGGANGFNFFKPQNIRSNKQIAPVVLTDLQIFNKSILANVPYNGHNILTRSLAETEEITLNYNENDLSVDFSALNFTNSEKNRYAYILEGFNNLWINTSAKNRRATYTNLDPGSYVLRVVGSNEDGVWNETGTSLRITILPPFWRSNWAYFLYAALTLGILFLSRQMIIHKARQRFALEQERKEAHRLHELDNLKIKFFTNVSHEFRTPLALIISPLSRILKEAKTSEQHRQLEMVSRNAKRLLNMVNHLLDFRNLENQEFRLNITQGDIIRFIREASYSFTDLAEKKNISFSCVCSHEQLQADFDADKLERILFNLLSNAFKFTPQSGRVQVSVKVMEGLTENLVEILVEDSGIGIDPAIKDKIFERFYQSDLPAGILNQGSGIGLAIAREFVKMQEGTITVDSAPGNGSRFMVKLPFAKKEEEPFVHQVSPGSEASISKLITAGQNHQQIIRQHTLLLVEDNEDFRMYLRETLQEYYYIIEAADGKAGWQKTLSGHPDLVVSDITMPEMNGIELCKKIKSDPRTRQIPVVLLTALTGEEELLNGLRTGVTDYMTKPFSVEVLLHRIKNILEHQDSLKKIYSRVINAKTTEIQADSPSENFIHRALEIVEKNMGNPDFSVEELGKELFMSRAATYKRIFAITGKSPIEFIRSLRLQKAAQLLTKTQMSVSEIAYEVGFNNPKYFSRYFKAEFTMVPSAYVAEMKKNTREKES